MERIHKFKLEEGGEVQVYHHDDRGATVTFESPLRIGVFHISSSVMLTKADRENLYAALGL